MSKISFRPQNTKAVHYAELPEWIFKINEEEKQQLKEKDKPKEKKQ